MAGTLGTIRGQIALDVRSAIAGYVAVRAANAATTYALSRSSAAFIGAARAMTAGGLLIAAGFGVAIKAAADFERQLDFFGAVSNSTEAEMEAVRVKALQLGQDTIFSAGQIADSFVELGKAGVSAKDIVNGVGDAVAHLGAAADIPLERAAQIMTSAVQTFELKAQDATHVADLLAGAANASIVEIEDLGVSLKYVGGVAAAISIPIEDVIDGLALLGKYGIRGSTAGTSLRQILVSLSGTSKKASATLKELGIITKNGGNLFFDAAGKAKPLDQIFQILQDHTKDLTEAQRLAAFKIIFNNRALAAANVLAREGAAGFAKMNGEISKTTAADVSAKRLDNLSGDIEILRGNLETLFIKTGSPMQEFLRGIVQGITQLVQAFANLDESTQMTILKILAIVGAGLLIMGAVSGIIGIVLKFINSMLLLAQAGAVVIKVVKAAAIAFRGLAAAMFLNPVGLIILAIIALIALFVILYKKSEGFRNFVNKLGSQFMEGWGQIVDFFKGIPGFFVNLWNTIRDAFTSGWEAVVNFFTNTIPNWFTSMVDTITSTISGWWSSFIGFWQALPGRIAGFVANMVNAVVNWFAQLPRRIGFIIGFLIGYTIRLWMNWQRWLFTTAMNIVNGIVNFFVTLPGRVATFFQNLYTRTVTLLQNLWTNSLRLSNQIVTGIINFFRALPGRVANFFQNMYARAVAWLTNFVAAARSRASAVVNGVISFIRSLPGRVEQFIRQMVSRAQNLLTQMVTNARNMASRVISAIRDGLNGLPGLVGGIFDRVLGAFRDMVGRAFNAAKDFAGGLWDGFKKGLGINSPSFIEKQMVQITDVIREETGTMKDQVRQVQNLGSRLTKVQQLQPTDQTLVSAYADASLRRLVDESQKLDELRRTLQDTGQSTIDQLSTRTDLAISTASLAVPTSATIQSAPSNSNSRLVEGTLSIDESGRAYISGIAEDVVDGATNYNATVERMN